MIISESGLILDYREFSDYPFTLQKDLTLGLKRFKGLGYLAI